MWHYVTVLSSSKQRCNSSHNNFQVVAEELFVGSLAAAECVDEWKEEKQQMRMYVRPESHMLAKAKVILPTNLTFNIIHSTLQLQLCLF